MSRLTKYRTLFAGILSPLLAAVLGRYVYRTLTQASTDRDADFVFRLSVTALVMAVPLVVTLLLALSDRRRGAFTASGKIGVTLALLSLVLVWRPVSGLIDRLQQAENLALSGVEAPPFDTVDIDGNRHRLSEHAGKVVLVNIWATWCRPCRREMPELERLYQERKDDGLMIFGFSEEDVETQKAFAKEIEVSYPLLTLDGDVPEVYATTARYPANFLIDREGRLQPAPSTDKPFEDLEAAVDRLLREETD